MDSPESNEIVASSSSTDSPVVQESPFFNFLRTLSPIKPVKAATHLAQGLSGINIPSPPPVFTSPRLHPESEIFFLERSKDFKTSNANPSTEHENRDPIFAGSEMSERSIGQLMSGLLPCNKKTQETKSVPLVQPSSPSGSTDEYLTDPVEAECMKSSDPASSCFYEGPEVLQSGYIGTKETISKVDDNNGKIVKHMEIGIDEKITSSGKTEGKSHDIRLAVEPGNMKDGGRQSMDCSDLMSKENNNIMLSEIFQEPASGEENTWHVEAQTNQHARALPHEPVEKKAADLEEVVQHQRGIRRRCLQFDASAGRRKFVSSNRGFSNPSSINRCSRAPSNPTELESSPLALQTSTNTCTMNSSQPLASTLIPGASKAPENRVGTRNGGNSALKAPLPSGIGLHLNSIVNAAAKGSTRSLSINSTEKEYQASQGEKRPSVLKLHILEEYNSPSLSKFSAGKISDKNYSQQEAESLVAENSSTSQFSYVNSDKFQEPDQLSLKDTGKRTEPSEDENCKHCNCRRSKCLKLYCECFAAGIYCAEPCACQECFNKPEYEDMVLATRKHIESRNPLAFAPKVIHRVTDSPAITREEDDKTTPSSARHKRGCNCKKSMCLKKYCECYQSGVGCSAACRCEGCKNSFGAKEGYGEISGMLSRQVDAETSEDLAEETLNLETKRICSEHSHPQSLIPLTPSFPSSKHGKGMLISHLPGRRLSSPEFDSNIISSYAQSPSSPRNLSTHDKRARMGRQGNVDIIFDQVEFSTTGSMDQLSPRWDGFENMCNITPSAQVSSITTAMSSPSSSRGDTKVSRVQLQGSVRFSGSLRWRSSPIAPMPWLGESKMCQEDDSDIGYEILDDDTPGILKDAHTPVKSVKASSPNQKRVSPPYNQLQNLRSSPSPVLRSGRKFVLQSISSLPSLTPHSDPKESSSTN